MENYNNPIIEYYKWITGKSNDKNIKHFFCFYECSIGKGGQCADMREILNFQDYLIDKYGTAIEDYMLKISFKKLKNEIINYTLMKKG